MSRTVPVAGSPKWREDFIREAEAHSRHQAAWLDAHRCCPACGHDVTGILWVDASPAGCGGLCGEYPSPDHRHVCMNGYACWCKRCGWRGRLPDGVPAKPTPAAPDLRIFGEAEALPDGLWAALRDSAAFHPIHAPTEPINRCSPEIPGDRPPSRVGG